MGVRKICNIHKSLFLIHGPLKMKKKNKRKFQKKRKGKEGYSNKYKNDPP